MNSISNSDIQVKPWVLLCPLEAFPCWLSSSSAFWHLWPMQQLPYPHGVQTGAPICHTVLRSPHKIWEDVIPKYLTRIFCTSFAYLLRIIYHTWHRCKECIQKFLLFTNLNESSENRQKDRRCITFVNGWLLVNLENGAGVAGCSTTGSEASIS